MVHEVKENVLLKGLSKIGVIVGLDQRKKKRILIGEETQLLDLTQKLNSQSLKVEILAVGFLKQKIFQILPDPK